MTLLSNEDNKEISLSTELSQASTEKVTLLVHVHRTKNPQFHWFYLTNSQFHITHNTPCLPPHPPDNFPKISVVLYFLQSGHPSYNGHLAIS